LKALAPALAALLLGACATPPTFEAPGWRRQDLAVAGRVLTSAAPAEAATGAILTVVIEGDGRSHHLDGQPSADPTPRRPVGFEIALAWPRRPVAWLGRLCQYVRRLDPQCAPADWTGARFSDQAVAATNAAIDRLKAQAGAERIALVGWSGGGVLATLVAAGRSDVAGLTTIAAPLDLDAWTSFHRITPLDGSQDPARLAPLAMAQAHLYGAEDEVTPPHVGVGPARRLGGRAEVWPQGHECCWAQEAGRIAGLIP
jgi:hypothetical protein